MKLILMILISTCTVLSARYQMVVELRGDGGGHSYVVKSNRGHNGAIVEDVVTDPSKIAELDVVFDNDVYSTSKDIQRVIIYVKSDGETLQIDAHTSDIHEARSLNYKKASKSVKDAVVTTKEDLTIPDKKEVVKESPEVIIE